MGSKLKNYYYLSNDVARLNELADDYRYIGREAKVIVNRGGISELVVFSRPTNSVGRKDKNGRTEQRGKGEPGSHSHGQSSSEGTSAGVVE